MFTSLLMLWVRLRTLGSSAKREYTECNRRYMYSRISSNVFFNQLQKHTPLNYYAKKYEALDTIKKDPLKSGY